MQTAKALISFMSCGLLMLVGIFPSSNDGAVIGLAAGVLLISGLSWLEVE